MDGISLETIYWYILIGSAVIALVLVLFGDIFDFDGPIDPMLVVPWFAFTSLFGYLGEKLTNLNGVLILAVSIILASGLVFLLNFYVLVPMRNAESTISTSEKELEGRIATVVTTIPIQGMGEIQMRSVTGSVNRPAAFYTGQTQDAHQGSSVLVIEVKDRICYVVPYEETLTL
ncbi:hypothetical protein BAU15_13135 [Enterococcus sp. JM4C]|uniref:hypothetical protein n=1 Tax=Candidatus Enterococcus huntleyi TaxID=1857217 RepID=UPI00137A1928|nr:hypothetical protein [Enterococcus sp. JM4C]KAF1297706.1 hypothetical protein BAU15_13135 [Enterococcus sp. JM4C]